MPELPEVETIKRGLSQLTIGKRITNVTYDWPKGFPNAEEDIRQFLIGATIVEIARRAKVLLIELDTKYSLVIHLKMTGQLVYIAKSNIRNDESRMKNEEKDDSHHSPFITHHSPADEVRFGAGHPNDSLIGELPDKTTRVTFDFSDGSKLFFNDQRKFGWVRLIPTTEVSSIDFMKKVGPEPLGAGFTPLQFRERVRRRANSNIKAVILDQTVLAGVGNIYADEGLWGARIHPTTPVNKLSDRQLNTLFNRLREVLELSIEKGGSSDKNYVNAEGKKGSYLTFANVFRREGKTCPRCGTTIIKLRVAGRGTHICPKCQKL